MDRLHLKVTSGGLSSDLSNASGLTFSNAIPGGFAQCSFTVSGTLAEVSAIPALQYLADVVLYDEGSNIVWEGYLADIEYTVGYGQDGVTVVCVGKQEHTNNQIRRMYIKRDLSEFIPRPYAEAPTFRRDDLIKADLGLVNTAGSPVSSAYGVQFTVGSGTTLVVSHLNAFRYWHPSHDLSTNWIGRLKFDLTIAGNPAGGVAGNCQFQIFGFEGSSGGYSGALYTNSTNGTSAVSVDIGASASFRSGFLFQISCLTAGATATTIVMTATNIRFTGNSASATTLDEPIYGSTIIRDLCAYFESRNLSASTEKIETDTSYVFETADFLTNLGTVRQALDYVTGFYDRYWAVWEGGILEWQSTAARVPDWTVANGSGVRMKLQPTMANSANQLVLLSRDMAGQQRVSATNDTDPNNIVSRAGKTRSQIIDLGTVSNGSPVTQISNIAYPQLRYEVMKGTLEIPAMAEMVGAAGQRIPAYRLRAGSVIRAPGAGRPRDFLSTSYDRRTLFIVRQVSVDWSSQTVTVTIDNNTDRLGTYLSRMQSTIGAKFAGVL